MKIISFRDANGESFGVVDDNGGVVDVGRKGPFPSLRAALTAGGLDEVAAIAEGATSDTTIDEVTLLPVVPNPDKIVCAGMNYKDHVAEFAREMPEHVTLFSRLRNTIVAHGDDIVRPRVSDNFDFEGELALIIGKVGAIGYCMGGGFALEQARAGANFKATVVLHVTAPNPVNPGAATDFKGRVLALHGSTDPVTPKPMMDALEEELTGAEVDWQIMMFGRGTHSFCVHGANNPPVQVYNEELCQQSYRMMRDFFAKTF
jgi:hypothetical protein